MESPFLSQCDPSINESKHLEIIEEYSATPNSSDDEIEDDFVLKPRNRRKGSIYRPQQFHKTRADVVKEVNTKLLPKTHVIFAYVCLFSCIYWLIVAIMPYYYIGQCLHEKNYELTLYVSIFLLGNTLFEYRRANEIVKIIKPLSGHSRLSMMQVIKLGLGFLGKLDIYTKYCFVLIAHHCASSYAWIATGLLIFWCASLIAAIIYNYFKGEVNYLQLTNFMTLFDIFGKYEIMYLEGEKSDDHNLRWTKRMSVLPVMKLFFNDIGQFIIGILYSIEQKNLSYFVAISLIISLVSSIGSVTILYIKYQLFRPNVEKDRIFLHCCIASIKEADFEKLKKLLGTPANFRKFGHEIRAEVFKNSAKLNYEIFEFLVINYIVKNDGLLQSETFHAKLINSFRNCMEYPEHLIHSLHLLTNEKNIYLNINKRISIASEGTILHCLVEDPCFILRTLESQNFDLIKYAVYLGSNVGSADKYGETPVTLVAKLNLSTLIKSCSTKRLMELFSLNRLRMNKEELDFALKQWAAKVVEYFAEQAENTILCGYLYRKFGIDSEKKRRTTTQYALPKN